MTIQESKKKFIQQLKDQKRSPSTIMAYSKDIDQIDEYFKEQLKKINVSDITTEDLNLYIETLKTNKKYNYTLKTVSRKINSMKTFFRFQFSSGITKDDPAQAVVHPKYEVSEPRILTKLEYRALRDVARLSTRLYTIIEILLQTGIRIGELSRLTLEDIVDDGKKKKIKIKTYASNPERYVELNEPASNALNSYLSSRYQPKGGVNNIFLTKNGNSLLIRNIRSSINRAFDKAGIKNATVNDIRNTFIMHQLKNGMGIEMLSEIVGHKRLTSTNKFVKLIDIKPKRRSTKIVPL